MGILLIRRQFAATGSTRFCVDLPTLYSILGQACGYIVAFDDSSVAADLKHWPVTRLSEARHV
jgi:hypothetical protein